MIAAYLSTCLTALVSAFFPVTPVEPYLLGLVAATGYGPVGLGIAAAVGQTIGKTVIFLGARGLIRSERLHRLTKLVFRRKRARAATPMPVPVSGSATQGGEESPSRVGDASSLPKDDASPRPGLRRSAGAVRARLRRWSGPFRRRARRLAGPVKAAASKLTDLLERPALTVPILFLSAVTGIPPLIATSVYIAGTRISTPVFAVVCLVGRSVRFIAIAYAPQLILG
jgi:uncharacterized membrane protein YdjX (TVP38/TMEM64 family)